MKNHTFKNFLKQVELNCLAMSNLSCSIYSNAKSSAKFYKEKIQIIVEYDKNNNNNNRKLQKYSF